MKKSIYLGMNVTKNKKKRAKIAENGGDINNEWIKTADIKRNAENRK